MKIHTDPRQQPLGHPERGRLYVDEGDQLPIENWREWNRGQRQRAFVNGILFGLIIGCLGTVLLLAYLPL